jgi:hypothetical protein
VHRGVDPMDAPVRPCQQTGRVRVIDLDHRQAR